VQKLKQRYKCEINKQEISLKRLKELNCSLLLLGGPRLPFTAQELQDIRRYIEEGGRVMINMTEGGEGKSNTNVNAMLE
jgi:intraflagellar transport protein 52